MKWFFSLVLACTSLGSARAETTVIAWMNGSKPKPMPTQTLTTLPSFKPAVSAPQLDKFGGWLAGPKCSAGTGFFRAEKIGDRWWLVTPEGHKFIHVGIATVAPDSGPTFKAAFSQLYLDRNDWARQTAELLHTHGFNGTGNWSDDETLATVSQRLVYTRGVNFMASFGKQLGITHMVSGHMGYQDELIPVFHPDFPKFCAEYAQQLAATKDDPWLLGIYSDNELQLPAQSLDRWLKRPADDPGHKEAVIWLTAHNGDPSPKLTDDDRERWIAHVMRRYYTLVGDAIRKVDSNHLYLGSRLHGHDAKNATLWKVAGEFLPVIAMNVYGDWTPTETVRQWERWSGRPMLATEWYAKGHDTGMANKTGAGWNVKTQRDRGLFYQNFTLALLESRGCVGWHWFKYADNDPANKKADPSNLDSNKGVINSAYKPYTELLGAMKALNAQVYPLTTYFDRR